MACVARTVVGVGSPEKVKPDDEFLGLRNLEFSRLAESLRDVQANYCYSCRESAQSSVRLG